MKSRGILWAAALGSPLIWFASHTAQFALARLTCVWHSNVILWVVAACALGLDAGSGLLAWKQWHREPDSPTAGSSGPRSWFGMCGVALSAGFFLVIVAQTIPVLMLAGCE